MTIYSFHCQTSSQFYDELCKLGEHSEKCPECGESRKTKLVKQLTMPQTPKVHSSDTKAQDRWGYNKTTTETIFAADIGRRDTTYDENALKAQVREKADKIKRKGSTVAMSTPNVKKPRKK